MSTFTYSHGLPDPAQRSDFYDGVPMKRAIAWVFDVVLIGVLAAILVPFTAFTAVFFFPAFMLIVGFLYRWSTIAGGSSTWGMRMMSVELRDAQGQRLDGRTAFMHTMGYTVSVTVFPLQLISVLLMLLTDRKQGLTDHVLGTAAINRQLR